MAFPLSWIYTPSTTLREVHGKTAVVLTDKGEELIAARTIEKDEIIAFFAESTVITEPRMVAEILLLVNKYNTTYIQGTGFQYMVDKHQRDIYIYICISLYICIYISCALYRV